MSTILQQLLAYSRRNVLMAVCLSLILLTSAASYVLWQYQQRLEREYASTRQRGESMLRALAQQPRITTEIATLAVALQAINQNLIKEEDAPGDRFLCPNNPLSARTRNRITPTQDRHLPIKLGTEQT